MRSVCALSPALTVAAALLAGSSLGCAGPKPPVNWQNGGGRLDLVSARWTFDNEPVEIRSRGNWAEVTVDGDVEMVLDRVGRVYTKYQLPVALLEPDGRLLGKNEAALGTVGSSYAALPGVASAWLAISPQGQVVKFSADGSQKPVGQWYGCSVTPYAQQACLLVSYLLFYEDEGSSALEALKAAQRGP